MAPVTLEGHTLGQRHRHYNSILRQALEGTLEIKPIDFSDNDLDNLMRIDLACQRRDVPYLLEVFKCDDIFYVSRAIKKSKWLFTDKQYAHVVNPEFLDKELFPHMLTKAITKFKLNMRIHLKHEEQVDLIYNYKGVYFPANSKKWLMHCSLPVVEKAVAGCLKQQWDDLPLLNRLCRKSFSIFKIILMNVQASELSEHYIPKTLGVLKKYTGQYLDVIESKVKDEWPVFDAKSTHVIMKKYSQRVFEKFELYKGHLDHRALADYIEKDNIENILSTFDKGVLHLDVVSYFLKKIPRENVYDLLKTLYDYSDADVDPKDRYLSLFTHLMQNYKHLGYEKVYICYQYIPFNIAYFDLRKQIYAESSPEERHEMLIVLLKCAAKDPERIHQAIQYYLERHINEPFNFNKLFVENVLELTETHHFAEKTWNTLNEIFHSMEVYIESTNEVQSCVRAVIVYKAIHGEGVPKIVEDKFAFDTLKEYRRSLKDQEDKEKLFNYLYSYLITRMETNVTGESKFNEQMSLVENLWNLLVHWQKEEHHLVVIDKINHLLAINKENSWHIDMSGLYDMLKRYRKNMFEESLKLHHCQAVCVNALKHDPNLLQRYEPEVEIMRRNERVPLFKFLSMLRVYWPQTLGRQWADIYRELIKTMSGHKVLVSGLYALLPQNELLDFVRGNMPDEGKIKWSGTDEDQVVLNLRKHIAKNMHLARPMLPYNVALAYAKGDYLQFALLALNGIFKNLKFTSLRELITAILDAPVSLKKHGIRLTAAKLPTTEILPLFSKIWRSTKNRTLRTQLFVPVRALIETEEGDLLDQVWELLQTFIADLHAHENKVIYRKFGRLDGVPQKILSEYFKKSYLFFRSLPAKADCHGIYFGLNCYAPGIIRHLDHDFVANEILLENPHNMFVGTQWQQLRILSAYLLCSESETLQMEKYHKVLGPVLEAAMSEWACDRGKEFRNGFGSFMRCIFEDFFKYKEYPKPVQMFERIHSQLENHLALSREQHYIYLTYWKLMAVYIKLYGNGPISPKSCSYTDGKCQDESKPCFGHSCLKYLRNDSEEFFDTIYMLFADSVNDVFKGFQTNVHDQLATMNQLIADTGDIQGCLLAINILPNYDGDDTAVRQMRSDILKILQSHPSEEVVMFYYNRFGI